MMKVVTFLKFWRVYNPGQVAGFEPELSDALIAAGVAVAYDAAGAAAGAVDPVQEPVVAPAEVPAEVPAAKVKPVEAAKDLGAPPVQGGAG